MDILCLLLLLIIPGPQCTPRDLAVLLIGEVFGSAHINLIELFIFSVSFSSLQELGIREISESFAASNILISPAKCSPVGVILTSHLFQHSLFCSASSWTDGVRFRFMDRFSFLLNFAIYFNAQIVTSFV